MDVMKVFGYILTILLVTSVILYLNKMDEVLGIYPYEITSNVSMSSNKHEFIYIGGNNFKTVGSKPIYANDCIGCGELGDINIYHSSESIEQTNYTLNANCNGKLDVVERGYQINEKGERIGERCVIVFPEGSARSFWTESPKDHWILSAPTLQLLQEFEASEIYRLYKSSLNNSEIFIERKSETGV